MLILTRPRLAFLVSLFLALSAAGINPGPASASAPADADPYALAVSDDGRFLVHPDGSPFFWLGDTAWELFHRLDREEADFYLEDRAEKGFSVIQAVVLAELDGLETPNPYGHTPLIDNDPAQPNEAYFEHVDYIVDRAADLGMYVGMLPTWGDKFNRRWGVGPEVFTTDNAYAYGQFLGERYRDDPIIWILGGDRNPEEEEDLEIIRAMARGIEDAAGQDEIITYHPMGGSRSWEWFHEDPWLDLNLFQSGHGSWDNPNYQKTREGYALTPVKPVLDAEPRYEDHPVDWDPKNGWFMEFDTRQAAYWSMLSGAAGHTYGNHNIWQMWQPGRQPVSSARTPWREAVSHPGSRQMGYMRDLFEARDWMRLRPDQDIIATDTRDGAEHIRAARAEDGSYAYVYTPYGHAVEVNLEALSPGSVQVRWFDPRTGDYGPIEKASSQGSRKFDPPGAPERGNDWVLVLERS